MTTQTVFLQHRVLCNPSVSAGHEDDPLQIVEGEMDEVICMPGTTTMNSKTEIRSGIGLKKLVLKLFVAERISQLT